MLPIISHKGLPAFALVHIGPYFAWVKVFRFIPEFRILRLTFHKKSPSKSWIRQNLIHVAYKYNWSKDTWNISIFWWHTASFKIKISKVQDFGNVELSPMYFVVVYSIVSAFTVSRIVRIDIRLKLFKTSVINT